MACALQRRAILVMHLARQHALAPGAIFGGGRCRWVRRPGKAWTRIHLPDRLALEPLERDAEEDEVDVGIDRRPRRPLMLQHEGAQLLGIGAIGVDREHAGERRLVAKALAE